MQVAVYFHGARLDEASTTPFSSLRAGASHFADLNVPHPDGPETIFLLHSEAADLCRVEDLSGGLVTYNDGPVPSDLRLRPGAALHIGEFQVRFLPDPPASSVTRLRANSSAEPPAIRITTGDGRKIELRPNDVRIGAHLEIGREPSSPDARHKIALPGDPQISARHAILVANGGEWRLQCLSKNGLLLDRHRVHKSATVGLSLPARLWIGREPLLIEPIPAPTEFVPVSAEMRAIYDRIDFDLAQNDRPVLVLGESGVGKTRLARRIHERSGRSEGPFVTYVNYASVAASQLFGHVRGAFTGASSNKPDAFQLAKHGTLFLDEIGDFDANTQTLLLRAIDEGIICPVGSNDDVKVDARVIAATWHDLRQAEADGTFRRDLLARLRANLPIVVPPLRERPEDIPPFIDAYLAAPDRLTIDDGATARLQEQTWPGNYRDLTSVLQAATIEATRRGGDIIRSRDLDAALDDPFLAPVEPSPKRHGRPVATTVKHRRKPPTREQLVAALEETGGNQRAAAALLEIPEASFRDYLKRAKIDAKAFRVLH